MLLCATECSFLVFTSHTFGAFAFLDHKASSRISFLNLSPDGIKRRKLIRDQSIQGYFTSTQMVVGEEAVIRAWREAHSSHVREHKQGRGSARLLIPLSSWLTQPSEFWSSQQNRLDNQTPLLSDVIEHKCEV